VQFFSVVNEFDRLIEQYGFKCPRKLWYDSLVALSKRLEGIFYCYVIARVHKSDGSLETTLWVGPIGRPDDGLDNLCANIELQIGYDTTLDENFFSNCQSKIIQLIDDGTLNSLLAKSKQELAEPSVRNIKYDVYTRHLLPLFQQVVAAANDDARILKSKKLCRPLIEKLLAEQAGETKNFFDRFGIEATTDRIWQLCYLHSL